MTTHTNGWLNARSALLGLGLSSVLKQWPAAASNKKYYITAKLYTEGKI